MKKFFIYLIFIFVLFLSFSSNIDAREVNVYVFYGKTCPHCEQALTYFNKIKEKYDLNVIKYEVWFDVENKKLMKKIANYLDVNATGVPFVIIDNTPIIGYSSDITNETYKYHIKFASKENFIDKVGVELGVVDSVSLEKENFKISKNDNPLKIPLFGTINDIPNKLVPVTLGLTLSISSFTILMLTLVVISMIKIKDNKKIYKLGFTFIAFLSLTYLLFTNFLTFKNITKYAILARMLIALLLLFMGTIKLNKYANNMDKIGNNKMISMIKTKINEKSFLISIIFIIILSILTYFVNFSYTAELQSIFNDFSKLYHINNVKYFVYYFIYILFYTISNIIIFMIIKGASNIIKKIVKNEEYLSLISGMIIFIVGILLILKPDCLMF